MNWYYCNRDCIYCINRSHNAIITSRFIRIIDSTAPLAQIHSLRTTSANKVKMVTGAAAHKAIMSSFTTTGSISETRCGND